ncbi:unnamed protein product, partial [Closterium sp. NIES-53]
RRRVLLWPSACFLSCARHPSDLHASGLTAAKWDCRAPHWHGHGCRSYVYDACGCPPFSVAVCGPVRGASDQPPPQSLQSGDLPSPTVDGEGWRCVGVQGL